MRRVLKAWVLSQRELVYWQGLDSLFAPFLRLHFENEGMYSHYIPTDDQHLPGRVGRHLLRSLRGISSLRTTRRSAALVRINVSWQVMQEFLAVFLHTIAYHDAALAHHLSDMGFIPELFAIPWCDVDHQ